MSHRNRPRSIDESKLPTGALLLAGIAAALAVGIVLIIRGLG